MCMGRKAYQEHAFDVRKSFTAEVGKCHRHPFKTSCIETQFHAGCGASHPPGVERKPRPCVCGQWHLNITWNPTVLGCCMGHHCLPFSRTLAAAAAITRGAGVPPACWSTCRRLLRLGPLSHLAASEVANDLPCVLDPSLVLDVRFYQDYNGTVNINWS